MERSCAVTKIMGPTNCQIFVIPETVTKTMVTSCTHTDLSRPKTMRDFNESVTCLTHPLIQRETIACLCTFLWVSLNQSLLKQSTQSDRFQASVSLFKSLCIPKPSFVNYMSFSISLKKQMWFKIVSSR